MIWNLEKYELNSKENITFVVDSDKKLICYG